MEEEETAKANSNNNSSRRYDQFTLKAQLFGSSAVAVAASVGAA